MKTKVRFSSVFGVVAALIVATSLSGCSVLYPNWNTTSGPGDSSTPSSSSSASASSNATESATPTPTPTVAVKKAQIAWVDSGVDTAAGVIYGVAEITNVVEDGGSCTLTFIGAGKTKTVTGKAESNATDTQCHPLELPIAGLPKGAALITMSYTSPTHAGTSAAVAVNIP
jgi:hypothetical protein